MGYHNETCGCAECGNYGQAFNPRAIHNQSCGCADCGNYGQVENPHAIHNQSCGCAECGNYPQSAAAPIESVTSAPPKSGVVMVEVPVDLVNQVRALIARAGGARPESS